MRPALESGSRGLMALRLGRNQKIFLAGLRVSRPDLDVSADVSSADAVDCRMAPIFVRL